MQLNSFVTKKKVFKAPQPKNPGHSSDELQSQRYELSKMYNLNEIPCMYKLDLKNKIIKFKVYSIFVDKRYSLLQPIL